MVQFQFLQGPASSLLGSMSLSYIYLFLKEHMYINHYLTNLPLAYPWSTKSIQPTQWCIQQLLALLLFLCKTTTRQKRLDFPFPVIPR